MSKVVAIDTLKTIRPLHRIVRKGTPVPYAVKTSVNVMFYDLERSVRSVHAHYRQILSERDVEGILRETHREDVARALMLGQIRRAA